AQVARKNHTGGNKSENNYLLSGKLKDMTLDPPKAFTGAPRSKGGYSYRRKQFIDKSGEHIPVFEIPAKPIEEYIWGKVVEAMNDPKMFIEHYLSQEYSKASKVGELDE